MNYAEDRLDRRAISRQPGRLQQEFDECQANNNHVGLGRLFLALGWNRQAIFHYGMQWMSHPSGESAAADYAQAVDLAGYAEIGLLALLVFRMNGHLASPLLSPSSSDPARPSTGIKSSNHFEQSADEMKGIHCGCGHVGSCGAYTCFIPMHESSVNVVLDALRYHCNERLAHQWQRQVVLERRLTNTVTSDIRHEADLSIPTAHKLLGALADHRRRVFVSDSAIVDWFGSGLSDATGCSIPKLLQFWTSLNHDCNRERCTDSGANGKESSPVSHRPLSPVVQLLLLKLFYLVVPSLAIEAVVRMSWNFDSETDLAKTHKSHWAYFVFIQSLALGAERIKPRRRRMLKHYHVPLWDRLWGLDSNGSDPDTQIPAVGRNGTVHGIREQSEQFMSNLEQLVLALRQPDIDSGGCKNTNAAQARLCPLAWMPPFLPAVTAAAAGSKPLFILGDSHVLSLAWQTIRLQDETQPSNCFLVVPVLTTGIKAWHFRSETRFFTNTCLNSILQQRLPTVATLLVSAGEIDCREGIGGPLLEGYQQPCLHDHVRRTVSVYVAALSLFLQSRNCNNTAQAGLRQILVLPVAPHLQQQRSKGRVAGQSSRRETMQVWNDELRRQLPSETTEGIYLLDYVKRLQIGDNDSVFALDPVYNADSTHMNSAFTPLLEQALVECGCNLQLLH